MTLNKRKVEKKAYSLILGAGKEGLFQSELWKLLDITNREASRILKKIRGERYGMSGKDLEQ